MAPKTPAGEMTAPELRKLIRAHNILSKIVIPKGTDREGLIKLIEGKNYKVDHKDKVIRPKQQRGKQITLKKAEELTKPKPVSEAVKKQRAEKKKEKEEEKKKDIKIAKKEAVQEFKSKQKEAKKKQPKPAPKPKPKPKKEEDEVKPKEKVGRPKIDPKKIKVIEPKKKEEPKPVKKIVRRQLQETKKTTSTKTQDKPDNLKIKKKLSEEEKAEREERKKYNQYKQDLKNFNISELRDIVKQYNANPERKRELRIKGESKDALIGKIAGYKMDKLFTIEIPAKKQRAKKVLTEEEKQQKEQEKQEKKKKKQEEAKLQRQKEKPFIPLRQSVGRLYSKYNKQLRENNYEGIKEIVKSMRREFNDIYEKIEEDADEKDIELDDDLYDEIEKDLDNMITQLKNISQRGLRGEFSEEFKKKQREEERKKREGK